jgi:hypothetical protein
MAATPPDLLSDLAYNCHSNFIFKKKHKLTKEVKTNKRPMVLCGYFMQTAGLFESLE